MQDHSKGILRSPKHHKSQGHVKFDEEAISEYDKERGQKMKIDEPKTPYEFQDKEREEEVRKLNQEKVEQMNFNLDKEFKEQLEEEHEEEEKEKKHKEFLEKRKKHYQNEFTVTQDKQLSIQN